MSYVPYRCLSRIVSIGGGRQSSCGRKGSGELEVRTSRGGDLTGAAAPDKAPDQVRRATGGIVRGAVLIAGLTVLSRLFGLVRTLVFSQTVGASCLGTAYVTANQVPNLIYELVLGGALTSAMVPILARSAERAGSDPAERARVSQISSALLTWSVVILVPLTLVIAAAAMPIATLLNPANANADCNRADMINATGHMLAVFAPQVILYGLSVVLYGLLQAYRRFTGPTLGPAISSLVVIAACLAFVPLSQGLPLARLPLPAELVLSVGTTLGIAALVVVGRSRRWRLHLRLRPVWRFPPGVARRAGGLALVGRGRARRRRPGLGGVHRAGQRARIHRGDRHLQLRLAGVQLGRRGAGHLGGGQRLPGAVRPGRAGLRPDLRRVDAGGPAAVLARHRGDDRGHRRARRPGPGQAAGSGAPAGRVVRPVRAGHRGVAVIAQPVPGDVRHRAAEGRGGRAGAAAGCS